MDWRVASFFTLGLWTAYAVFGAKSTEIHGEKVGMFFETSAFIFLSLMSLNYASDFSKVTCKSAIFGAIMALGSAGGVYLMFFALHKSPQNAALITLICGMFPVFGAVILSFMTKPLLPHQWVGVVLASAGLCLVNWTK